MCCYVKIRSNAQHVVSHKWTKLVLKLAIKRQLWEVREKTFEKNWIFVILNKYYLTLFEREKNDNVFYVCLCHNCCHAYRTKINFSIRIHYFLYWFVSYLTCKWTRIYIVFVWKCIDLGKLEIYQWSTGEYAIYVIKRNII